MPWWDSPVAPVVDTFAEIVFPIPWPINTFSTLVIKRLYPLWYLRKLVLPLKYSIFSMLLGLGLILRLGSRDSVLRVPQYLIPYRKKKSGHKISSVKKILGKNFATGKIIRHILLTNFFARLSGNINWI